MIPGRKRRSLVALALSAILVSGPLAPVMADSATNLSGTVLHNDGVTPAKNVTVRLRDPLTGQEFSSKPSDSTGKYEIEGVPDGEYTIIVSTGGGEFLLPSRVTITEGAPSTITLIMTFAASEAAGKPAGGERAGKPEVLIPTIGGILVAAFAAKEIFEKDDDASPKLP